MAQRKLVKSFAIVLRALAEMMDEPNTPPEERRWLRSGSFSGMNHSRHAFWNHIVAW